MPWKTCGEAHTTNLHTDTRAPSEADLSGNQPIATHEGSLKLTANAEPEHPRQSLWRESVRAFLTAPDAKWGILEVKWI